ncbi:hypothetical protein [uncultured Winogradskyella sp.]|uniref:hypothetical protein n=1 Tax=uncultured Winogradskyella sp. TaxID=395353 RepID=UPI0026079E73|nr:hypothetical protein [uncultured Winogradskyella sp.]
MLDTYYITIFNHYKKRFKKQSIRIALIYIISLEFSIIIALGAFFLAFANQMKMATMSVTKFWVLLSLIGLFIIFKNWMRYNGKKRNILNAKLKVKGTSVYLLWLLPVSFFAMALIFLQTQ